jgi:hypothetical protein
MMIKLYEADGIQRIPLLNLSRNVIIRKIADSLSQTALPHSRSGRLAQTTLL